MRLANKVAIITGGGSGIGKVSAHLFAKEGAKVVVAQRTESTGEETAAAINASGGEAIFVRTDVSVASEVENLVKKTVDTFGKVDILFNNAGTFQVPTRIIYIDEAEWDRIYTINVKSIFLGVKYVVPEMRKGGGGVIINTGSSGGVRPRMYMSAYATSKGAVITLTRALALELAQYNIRVVTLNPGITETPIIKDVTEEGRKGAVMTVPMGRIAEPEEIANVGLFLASEGASYVSGVTIIVDGGSMWVGAKNPPK